MKRFMAAALAVGCLVSPATVFAADDAGAFDKWVKPDAPECVPVCAIKSDGLVDMASAARELPHI
jgi:hypothetical protein